MSHVSSHPVLPHQRDDAGRRTRLRQEGVLEDLAGRGPLSRVSHQHPVQEALEQRGDLGEKSSRVRVSQVLMVRLCRFVKGLYVLFSLARMERVNCEIKRSVFKSLLYRLHQLNIRTCSVNQTENNSKAETETPTVSVYFSITLGLTSDL